MSSHYPQLIREILHKVGFRYLSVRPHGFEADGRVLLELRARVLHHGPARTLYSRRRPACRSLDGVAALSSTDKTCADCADRQRCTPQVRLDFLHGSEPYRVLLAFTSAKNFLLYETELRKSKTLLHEVVTCMRVVHRGTWGEVRFRRSMD